MSGRKNFLLQAPIVTAGDMSGNLTSKVTNIQGLDNIGIQWNVATGTPSGTVSVQVSIDHNEAPAAAVTGNWVTLSSQVITSGSPSPIIFNLQGLATMWIRTIYTASGGTGTGNAFICGKML